MAKAKRNYDDSNLPRFDDMDPASLIAWVTAYTLAKLSKHPKAELVARGWYDSAAVDLYKFGSSGVWVLRETLADGTSPVEYLRVQHIGILAKQPTISLLDQTTVSQLAAYYAQRRCATVLVNIAAAPPSAAVTIVAPLSGYKPRCFIKGVISDTTDAATTLTMAVSGGTLSGKAVHSLNLTAHVMNTAINDLLLYGDTAFTGITCTISDGPGAGASNTYIQVEYWYEA